MLRSIAIAALATVLAVPAGAATVKQAWNLPADAVISNGTVNGRVTAPSDCLLDNEDINSCANAHVHTRPPREKDEG